MYWLHVDIFLFSTAIMALGAVRFYFNKRLKDFVYALILTAFLTVLANGVDVFVKGDLTLFRQVTYLSNSIVFTLYSIRFEIEMWYKKMRG